MTLDNDVKYDTEQDDKVEKRRVTRKEFYNLHQTWRMCSMSSTSTVIFFLTLWKIPISYRIFWKWLWGSRSSKIYRAPNVDCHRSWRRCNYCIKGRIVKSHRRIENPNKISSALRLFGLFSVIILNKYQAETRRELSAHRPTLRCPSKWCISRASAHGRWFLWPCLVSSQWAWCLSVRSQSWVTFERGRGSIPPACFHLQSCRNSARPHLTRFGASTWCGTLLMWHIKWEVSTG